MIHQIHVIDMPDKAFSYSFFILVVVCLFGAISPALAVNPDEIENHLVSQDVSRAFAEAAHIEYIISGSPGLEYGSWEGTVLTPEPLVIYDTNGQPLFYQFEVCKDDLPLGGIRIGASRVLPSSVMAIDLTPPYWNNEDAKDTVLQLFSHMFPGCTINSTYPVCYDYPRIGQKITFTRPESTVNEELIVDFATASPVPEENSRSYYEGIGERAVMDNRAAWDEEESIHRIILEKAQAYGYAQTTPFSQDKMQALRETTTVHYGAGSGEPVDLGAGDTTAGGKKTLPLTLYPQQSGDWCAVASIQMISDYFGTYFSQDDIARLTNTRGGMYVEDQVEFFIKHLGKEETYADYNPSFKKEMAEIANNRPFGSNVESPTVAGGHARVGAGYNDDWGRKEIFIYDPWPVNQGSVYWEPFSSESHLCDVFIRGSGSPRIEPPVARFSYSFDKTTVAFTDLSTGNPDEWYWTFGDGTTATSQNPTHTYSQPGSYWVSFTASNSGGSSRSILAVYIPGETPTAAPTTAPTIPVTVYPTIFPKVIPTIGPTTVPTIPVTAYPTIFPKVIPTIGPTTVPTIPVTAYPTIFPKVIPTIGPTTVPTIPVTAYPTIFPKVIPTAAPTISPISPIPVASFQHVIKGTHAVFVDTSDANPMEWSWNFGDGKSSMVRNPTHTYEKPGTYTITLTVSNSAGSSTASKVLIIK